MSVSRESLVSKETELTEHVFKPFHETFKWITFFMTLGFLFPNPARDRFRITMIVSLLIITLPLSIMIFIDIYKCWLEKDIFNIIRHSTIVGPFLGAFFKMFLMFYKRVQAKHIIDEMNHDYQHYNNLQREIQEIATEHIRQTVLYTEVIWGILVSLCISAFPLMAIFMTLFSAIFMPIPTKYMVHDLNKPFSDPKERFESPYFEVTFVYMVGSAFLCIFNYVSYDAFFGLATSHAVLKMRVFCKKLEATFQEFNDEDIYKGLIAFIEEQKKMYEFVDKIQDAFNIWLGTICISTMIQIGSLLFHISAGYGFDLRYTLFSFTAVIHIFLPCTYVTRLKTMSTETATMVYCSGWEKSRDRRIRRMMPFLIARAQVPCRITAFYMFDFDMELFVFMMRTSYSMFTLLTS